MGIIGCKVDFNYNQNELQEEVKMDKNDDNILKKICIEFNNSRNQDQYKTNYNYETRNYGSEKHADITGFANFEKNYKKNKNSFKVKSNKGKKIFGLKKNRGEIENNDELVIITPGKDNNIFLESFNNDITDDYTIKNETAVYNNENNDMKTNNLNEIKEEEKKNNEKNEEKNNIIIINNQDINKEDVKDNNIKNKKKLRKSSYNNDKKGQKLSSNNNSKSFIAKKKVISKKLNLNNPLQKSKETNNNNISERNNNIDKEMNNINNNAQKEKSKNKSLPNHKKIKNLKINNIKANNINDRYNILDNNNYNDINNKSYNNINYLKNNYFYPLYSSFQLSNIINNSKNQQTSTLDQNIQLKNILLHQLPIIKKEEILSNIERKTYQEDIFPLKGQNISNNKKISDREYYNQIYTEKNKYYLLNNNNQIMDKLNDIYNALYTRNNILNYSDKNYKKSKSPGNSYDNQIFKRDTNFHARNNSFNNNYNYSMNNDNNNNSFFSLFNNSTNLSINFINKANKFTQPSNVCKKALSYVDRKYENKNNNKNNYRYTQNNNIGNPFLNYNNFDKKHYSGKKNTKNKTYLTKVKPKLSNSKSFNNIMNISDINNINILSQQYRDLIEVYMPQKEGNSLIDNEIINNIIGNKYIFSYKKINNFDTEKILYDGALYKVIDNMENDNKDEDNKYKLLPRYFQITKNCFKYYNDMNEAINEKDKPLVQFDIRFIQNLDIIENNFLEKYTINNKNVEIVFCIYIKQNNDFFVFAHNNKKIGKTVINIILFLIRYYEDRQ